MSGQTKMAHRGSLMLTAAVAACTAAVAACSAPGAAQPQSSATATIANAASGCGKAPVTLNAYIETGFQVPNSLMAEFTKQYPNVKVKYKPVG